MLRPEGIEGRGDVLVRQPLFQGGGQVLDAALDGPLRLNGLRVDLAVDEVRPAEEEGVGEEHLQVHQGIGSDLVALLSLACPDLGDQGFDGRQMIVRGVQPVLVDETKGGEKGRGIGQGEAVVDPGRAEIPGPVE